MKKFLFILFLFLLSSLNATDYVVKGKVRHINTHEEISDVNIYVKDLSIGTTSDKNGRFTFHIETPNIDHILVFSHVAFDTMQISLKKAITLSNFYIKPNLLQTNKIIVEAKKAKTEFAKDLPQSLTIINAREFEGRGYIDVGDLLRVDQSIIIEEDLSGKKTISMRGGNAEDVVVFYNGVKMNNNYDNVFNLSLINIEDIEQIEIIKGSNTALFGSDAFSGVINIIPKTRQNYTARFIQKIGSYNSGDWNLQLNHEILKDVYVSYNQKRAGSKRPYALDAGFLKNDAVHYSASLLYDFSDNEKRDNKNISIMYMRSDLGYDNNNLSLGIDDLNQLVSARYKGSIGSFDHFNMTLSYQNLDNRRTFIFSKKFFDRYFLNENYYLNIEKSFFYGAHSLLTAYQYENGKLDFKEESTSFRGLESALLTREKHGAVGILKFIIPTGSKYLSLADLNLSYRFDYVKNQQYDVVFRNNQFENELFSGLFAENDWKASTLKFSAQLKGGSKRTAYTFYLSVGNNTKFPTMFHQLSTPAQFNPERPEVVANLSPEQNHATELGFELMLDTPNEKNIDGIQFTVNYFKNMYQNKFRSFFSPTSGIAFFDNVPNADISGIEAKIRSFFLQRIFSLEVGSSNLFISEKAAFPFKSESKYTVRLFFDYSGYSATLYWFNESSQFGWIRFSDGLFGQIELAGFTNMDFHLSKSFEIYNLNYNLSFSIRNLMKDDFILEGIAIRDRRFYLGFGIEY